MIENNLLSLDHFSRLVSRQHFSRLHVFSFLLFRFLLFPGLFRVIGGRNLEDGVDQEAEIWLLVANAEVKVLVNFVEGLWIDPFREVGVLFSPVLEDQFEIRTYAYSFL